MASLFSSCSLYLEPVHAELGDERDVIRGRGVCVVYVVQVGAVSQQPLPAEVIAVVILVNGVDLEG